MAPERVFARNTDAGERDYGARVSIKSTDAGTPRARRSTGAIAHSDLIVAR